MNKLNFLHTQTKRYSLWRTNLHKSSASVLRKPSDESQKDNVNIVIWSCITKLGLIALEWSARSAYQLFTPIQKRQHKLHPAKITQDEWPNWSFSICGSSSWTNDYLTPTDDLWPDFERWKLSEVTTDIKWKCRWNCVTYSTKCVFLRALPSSVEDSIACCNNSTWLM